MIVDVDRYRTWELGEQFLEPYRSRPVPWRYGALSWITYERTHSRDGEEWWQTCRRVIEGRMTVKRVHCLAHDLPWGAGRSAAPGSGGVPAPLGFKWTPRVIGHVGCETCRSSRTTRRPWSSTRGRQYEMSLDLRRFLHRDRGAVRTVEMYGRYALHRGRRGSRVARRLLEQLLLQPGPYIAPGK